MPDLAEQQVSQIYNLVELHNWDEENVYTLGDSNSGFRFINHKLVGCALNARNDIEIGPSSNGRFITLPAKASEVHRLFGKPLRHGTFQRPPT